jgi:5-methyltetrahydropteroyltriglutamate--homocysteine methyltransferase
MKDEYEGIVEARLLPADRRAGPRDGAATSCTATSPTRCSSRRGAHVEAINHALRDVPADRVRAARLLGQLRGPAPPRHRASRRSSTTSCRRSRDDPLRGGEPAPRARVAVWRDAADPRRQDPRPGVLDTTANYIEHPSSSRSGIETSPTSSAPTA